MKDTLSTAVAYSALTPTEPDYDKLPQHVDRRTAARLVGHFYFPVSARSIERWPLPGVIANGRLVHPTREVLRHAKTIFEAGARTNGGAAAKRVA